jgi:hypothetical protein
MKLCPLHFDPKYCEWKLQKNISDFREIIEMCAKLKCPHGSITEMTLKNGERVAFVTCDYSWNPVDWRETTQEERDTFFW